MSWQAFPSSTVVITSALLLASVMWFRQQGKRQGRPDGQTVTEQLPPKPIEQLPEYARHLAAELPTCIITQADDPAGFKEALDYSWAQQNREIIPACIVRPRDVAQLSKAVAILKREHDARNQAQTATPAGFFAVRSGGGNPGLGVAGVKDGVMIDLSLFCEVTPSADGSTVTLGTGAKWIDVYTELDKKGLVVMGGRNSPVGVGGLALQGGISFYSPRHGFVCSNAMRYEVVLANGSVVRASASENPELWRVLKGGSNNFGIVTRFTLRSFPSAPLWVAQVFAPAAFQHAKAQRTFHDYLQHVSSGQLGAFDENAAGPILSFAYVQRIGVQIIALHLVYTKVEENNHKWPAHWKRTGFPSLWKFYHSSKVQSHTAAVENLGRTSPAGTRHTQGTTTIRNDFDTITTAYAMFCETTRKLRHIKGLLFPFTFQAILPAWMNKGHPTVLGLEGCTEPLIIVSCSVTWPRAEDDEFIRSTVQDLLVRIGEMAAAKKTGHPYRFMNYAMEWQRPYEGCGEENLTLMREASRKYDPDGLFQTGCVGGFKIGTS